MTAGVLQRELRVKLVLSEGSLIRSHTQQAETQENNFFTVLCLTRKKERNLGLI